MVRYGNQTPTFETYGGWDHTDGPEMVSTFEQYGYHFTPWQAHKLDLYGARNADNSFAATNIGDSTPRRNGKSFPARLYAAWEAAIEGNGVLYSAHNGSVVSEMFKELCKLFDDPVAQPDWAQQTDYVYRQPGREGIYLNNGGLIEFNTRTNGNSRGVGYKVIIIDEAQEFTDAQADSLLPTTAASSSLDLVVEDPQIIYIGTPIYPECHGTVFSRMHDAAHSGEPGDTWWSEFATKKLPPKDISDNDLLDLLYRMNPGLGYKVSIKALLSYREKMSWEGFCRECLGWWMPTTGGYEHAIEEATWNSCAIDDAPSPDGAKVAYGVKFAPDGTHAAVCVAVKRENAPVHVELVKCADTTHGAGWVSRLLAPMADSACCYLADGRGTAENMEQQLRASGSPRLYCRTATTKDVVQADARFMDLVGSHGMTHYSQPELTASVVGSARRRIGSKQNGAFGFGDAPNVDSAPVEAAALAVHAVMTTLRDPHKVQRVVSF